MDTNTIQKLLRDVQESLDTYQSDTTETSRVEAQEKALKLARALEKPRDAILKIAYSVSFSLIKYCLFVVNLTMSI